MQITSLSVQVNDCLVTLYRVVQPVPQLSFRIFPSLQEFPFNLPTVNAHSHLLHLLPPPYHPLFLLLPTTYLRSAATDLPLLDIHKIK